MKGSERLPSLQQVMVFQINSFYSEENNFVIALLKLEILNTSLKIHQINFQLNICVFWSFQGYCYIITKSIVKRLRIYPLNIVKVANLPFKHCLRVTIYPLNIVKRLRVSHLNIVLGLHLTLKHFNSYEFTI